MKQIVNGYDECGQPICCAVNKKGRPCHNPAGEGTDHIGLGFCHNHDTANDKVHPDFIIDGKDLTAMPIYVQLLPHNMRFNWKDVAVTTQQKLDEQIKLCDVRIYILMQRIKRVENIGQFLEITHEEGHTDKDGTHTSQKRRLYAVEDTIVKLESEITKLQTVMLKAIDLRSKLDLLQTSEGDTGNIEKLVGAIRQSHTFMRTTEDVGVIEDV